VLRYGFFYGPGTWSETASRVPSVHIDAAARATLLALTKAKPGIYNIAEDSGAVSSEKAKREFGFDPGSRIRS
jgi:nucleoside-diphosphate-sugar epimerase